MALIEATIGTTGDYGSLALAEASIPGSSADEFEFTYIEALADTTGVLFNAASFTGSVIVDVLAAYRHGGAVSGSHAQLHASSGHAIQVSTINVTIQNLRVMRTNATARTIHVSTGMTGSVINNCVLVQDSGTSVGVYFSDADGSVLANSFIVGRFTSTSDSLIQMRAVSGKIWNCSVFLVEGTAHSIIRSLTAGATTECKNVVCVAAAGATATNGCFFADTGGIFEADCENNVSTDATAPGTSPTHSADPADLFTVLTADSEDLHFPSYTAMAALPVGSDPSAGAYPTDIDGNTIVAWYPGGDYVEAPVAASAAARRSGLGLYMGLR